MGLSVATVVVMKGCMFWDKTPYNPLQGNRICLHLQNRIKSQAGNSVKQVAKYLSGDVTSVFRIEA
jgi:hypothetical protein